MATPGAASERMDAYRTNYGALFAFAKRYQDDSELRSRIDSGDVAPALDEIGISLPQGFGVRIVCDTKDTCHIVLPPDPNGELSDEALTAVAGGKSAGTAGSLGSASSVACSTVPSSVGSAGSASTAGTAS